MSMVNLKNCRHKHLAQQKYFEIRAFLIVKSFLNMDSEVFSKERQTKKPSIIDPKI